MKIIKEGKLPNDKMKGKCNCCGAEIECSKKEAKFFDDWRESYYIIKCPTKGCPKDIYVV